jgi:hypothetical protein
MTMITASAAAESRGRCDTQLAEVVADRQMPNGAADVTFDER